MLTFVLGKDPHDILGSWGHLIRSSVIGGPYAGWFPLHVNPLGPHGPFITRDASWGSLEGSEGVTWVHYVSDVDWQLHLAETQARATSNFSYSTHRSQTEINQILSEVHWLPPAIITRDDVWHIGTASRAEWEARVRDLLDEFSDARLTAASVVFRDPGDEIEVELFDWSIDDNQ
jgi:hypothetical protein